MDLRGRGLTRRLPKGYDIRLNMALMQELQEPVSYNNPPIQTQFYPLLNNNPKTLKKRLEIIKSALTTHIKSQRAYKQRLRKMMEKQDKLVGELAYIRRCVFSHESLILQIRKVKQKLEAKVKKDQDARKRQGLEAFPTGEAQETSQQKGP